MLQYILPSDLQIGIDESIRYSSKNKTYCAIYVPASVFKKENLIFLHTLILAFQFTAVWQASGQNIVNF